MKLKNFVAKILLVRMFVITLISWLNKVIGNFAAKMSGAHPLWYVLIYICIVPAFAEIYCNLPGSFYAPYARLEHGGRADLHHISEVIQSAMRRNAEIQNTAGVSKWKIVPEMTYVQRLHANPDGVITFDILVMARNQTKNKDLSQFPIAASLKHGYSLVQSYGQNNFKQYRVFELERPFIEKVLDPSEELPIEIEKNFRQVEVLPDEERAISRFFDGIMGDPLSFSDPFPRMLYFSAVVITTVGFGDIVPITDAARSLVALEALSGIVLVGLFLNSIAFHAARSATRIP